MRLHADPKHSDFQPASRYAEVYFNGTKVENVRWLDDVEGWIDQMVFLNGRPVIEGDTVKYQRRYGEVRVIENAEHPLERKKKTARIA